MIDEPDSLSTSTASFRAICEDRPDTLPHIKLDLTEKHVEELTPRLRAAVHRLQAILSKAPGEGAGR